MDLSSVAGSVLGAVGLAGAAGLNAWLPLLAAALLARWGVVDLAAPFGDLSTDGGLALLAGAFALDFTGDKIPAVDHVLHVVGGIIAPASGAALFTGQTGLEADVPTAVALAAGGGLAGGVHGLRAAVRPASTATTGGLGNPVLSLVEDAGSLTLTLVAFALPVLAAAAVVLIVLTAVSALRRRVGSRRAREERR